MTTRIRLATPDDAPAIQAIYEPIVHETIISFELAPPSVADMRQRIADTIVEFPWVVCERHGWIAGYAYATRYRTRPAYQWCVDVSVYTSAQARRRGVGRGCYTSLFSVLKLQGYVNAYAGIALPNDASVALHESLGFRPVGVYESVGYKLGGWHDVGWWQLRLQKLPRDPKSPLTLSHIRHTPDLQSALTAGLPLLGSDRI